MGAKLGKFKKFKLGDVHTEWGELEKRQKKMSANQRKIIKLQFRTSIGGVGGVQFCSQSRS